MEDYEILILAEVDNDEKKEDNVCVHIVTGVVCPFHWFVLLQSLQPNAFSLSGPS